MLNWLDISLLIIILLILMSIMTFIPYWTRRTESFGVSIPEDVFNDPNIRALRRSYIKDMTFFNIAYLAINLALFIGLSLTENQLAIFYTASVLLYLLFTFFIYLKGHRSMKSIKEEAGWFRERKQQLLVHTKFREGPLALSHKFYLIPLAIVLLTLAWTILSFDRFPEEIPLNYSLTGEVTNIAEKSFGTVLLFPILQLFLTFIFLFVNIVINRSKQQVSATNPELSLKRNQIFRRRWSIFLFISGLLLISLLSLMQVSLVYAFPKAVIFFSLSLTIIGTLIGSIYLSISTGQGGSRIKLDGEVAEGIIDRDDDQHWKLGQFYFNKEDPAIFIEKRFGIGWTANFARPMTWIILLLIIGLGFGLPLLLTG